MVKEIKRKPLTGFKFTTDKHQLVVVDSLYLPRVDTLFQSLHKSKRSRLFVKFRYFLRAISESPVSKYLLGYTFVDSVTPTDYV